MTRRKFEKPKDPLAKFYLPKTIEYLSKRTFHGVDYVTILDYVNLSGQEYWFTLFKGFGEPIKFFTDQGFSHQLVNSIFKRVKEKIEKYKANPTPRYEFEDIDVCFEAREVPNPHTGRLYFTDVEVEILDLIATREERNKIIKKMKFEEEEFEEKIKTIREKQSDYKSYLKWQDKTAEEDVEKNINPIMLLKNAMDSDIERIDEVKVSKNSLSRETDKKNKKENLGHEVSWWRKREKKDETGKPLEKHYEKRTPEEAQERATFFSEYDKKIKKILENYEGDNTKLTESDTEELIKIAKTHEKFILNRLRGETYDLEDDYN